MTRTTRTVLLALLITAAPLARAQDSEFIRGDANTDGILDIADPVHALDHLFFGGEARCREAIDANDDGAADVSDAVYLLTYLFLSGEPPSAPFDWCGPDPTPDSLGCESNLTCDLGGPIEGLTLEEHMSFNRGRDVMNREFKPSEGLGPFYSALSCKACHGHPASGGSAPLYRNFYLVAIGVPGEQHGIDGLPSQVLPSYYGLEAARPTVPASTPTDPVVMAQRNTPPFFGVGLFEFVTNDEILSHADEDGTVTPGDGISGRYNTDGFGHVGRFGFKSQANFIEAFIRGAIMNHGGITTDPVEGAAGAVSLAMRRQISTGLDEPTTDDDGVPDPELSVEDLADLIDFCRFLAPPKPLPFGPEEVAGEQLFDAIGCTGCHVPTLQSAYGPLDAYTDLLLHDMGPGLADGISMGMPQFSTISPFTTESEWRTQPLWGVRMHRPYLHDGRADTLEEAILLHGGEALSSRQAFEALDPADQMNIIKFLEAL